MGEKKLETLQTKDITQALDTIVNRGAPVHANKVLAALKQALGYGVRRGSIKQNPAESILAKDIGGMEKPRERHLTVDEIKKLWLFLDSDEHSLSSQTISAIKIILLTGVRTGELRLAQWSEFDFKQSLWTIPAEHSKSRTDMKIHLSPQVQSLLLGLKKQNNSVYVIPGIDENSPIADKTLSKAVKRIQERVGIKQWTPHDLRRTFATQLGETLHVDPVVIEKCLGHKMSKIMATYNKNEMLLQRKNALNQWGQYVDELFDNERVVECV